MKRRPLLVSTLILSSSLQAEPVYIQGSNTFRLEHYNNSGDPAGSPFAFEGPQGFNDFSLSASQNTGQYRRWEGQISGVLNDSDFRAQQTEELLVERWSLKGEWGDTEIPVRAEVGDYQAFFSLASLQRSLKGVQLELQPQAQRGRHSLQFIAGANTPDWRDPEFNRDKTFGVSWLGQFGENSRSAISWINNQQSADPLNNNGVVDKLDQQTVSLSNETRWVRGERNWLLETELSHFIGDHSFTANGLDQSDKGVFAQLSANHSKGKGNYRFRFERYGQDFRPNGAVVSSNRRSIELHNSWRFDSGISASARIQQFRDALDSANPSDTQTIGINLSGNLLGKEYKNITGSIAAFVQENDNFDQTVDRRTESVNMNLSFPVTTNWTGRTRYSLTDADNLLGDGDSRSANYSLSLSRRINWRGFTGQIAPVISFRDTASSSPSEDRNIGLSANISRGNHQLSLSSGFNRNRPELNLGSDSETLAMSYRYRRGAHQWGVEFNDSTRTPVGGQSSVGQRISVFWNLAIDAQINRGTTTASTGTSYSDDFDLLTFAPGRALGDIQVLDSVSRSQFGDFQVSEVRVFPGSDQRQRLVIQTDGQTIQLSAVIIDFDDTGSLDSVEQIFEQTRQLLVRRYGQPDEFLDRGEFSDNLAFDVASDRFIRTMQWRTENGILRFGIPRRLDGSLRMELQYRDRFTPLTDTLWSIEEVF